MNLPPQLPRIGIVFTAIIVVFVATRTVLVPRTFGKYGHYRAAAVDSIGARQVKFAGRQECEDCHDDIAAKRLAGNHRGLGCEVCHGPAENHVQSPADVTPGSPRDRTFCPKCHAYNPSRPTGFPQIDPVTHNPLKPCISCHDPHAPVPPRVPQECAACHAQIARVKALSHHVNLPCTTCHTVPQEHKINPLAVRPTKPTDRAFCAQCHDKAATRKSDAPRIVVAAHYQRYLCWQCHYPHYPQAN